MGNQSFPCSGLGPEPSYAQIPLVVQNPAEKLLAEWKEHRLHLAVDMWLLAGHPSFKFCHLYDENSNAYLTG